MKKIALFLLSDYTKSWVDSGILDELSAQADLVVYGHRNAIAKINERRLRIKTIEIPEIKSSRSTQRLQLVALINRRSCSTSFTFRLSRLVFGDLKLFPHKKTPKILAHSSYYNLRRLVKFTLSNPIELISFFRPIGNLFEHLLRRKFTRVSYEKFQNIELDESIELVLLPSAAIEDRIYELIEFLKTTNVASAICIENWDNLTSKSILIAIPDYVFVMGRYCKEHGVRIQGLQESQIVVAGLPRFNPYRRVESRYNNLGKIKKSKFRILYLGFSVPHNERNLVGDLISLLDVSEMRDKYEFCFKPHPARQMRFYESNTLPSGVKVIDNKSGATGFNAIPTIGPEHIQNLLDADIVIATPTSMAIESMLLGVPTIIDGTDDGVHRTTAMSSLKEYLHLRDLQKIEGILIGKSPAELLDFLLDEFLGQASQSGPDLEKLIESKRASYASHLTDLVNRL